MTKTNPMKKAQKKKTQKQNNVKKPAKRRSRVGNGRNMMVNANINNAKRYMDPEGKVEPPASTSSLGNFTTVNSVLRQLLVTSSTPGTDLYVCVQWGPSSARLYYWGGITGTPGIGSVSLGNLATNVPVTSKPLRLSVAVRNTTVFTGTEGSVRVLCMPQSLDWTSAFATPTTLTATFCASVDSMIEANNKTQTYTAAELHHGKKWIFAPVSNVGYNDWYEQNEGGSLQNVLVSGSKGDAFTTFLAKMPYVANRNTYDFTVRSQDGARYAANTALANTAKSAQRSQPGMIEHIHSIASDTAHIAEDVGHVFSSVGNAIPQIAGGVYNAFRTFQGIRSLIGSTPAIAEAAEAAPLLLL